MIVGRARLAGSFLLLFMQLSQVCFAQHATVKAQIKVLPADNTKSLDYGNAVLWLKVLNGLDNLPTRKTRHYSIVQKDKSFSPHVLAVPLGTRVEFPNKDPFFHNVFSLFQGKRFDLGLYEAGSSREVLFDKPGVSFIFCNIHPGMSAYVIALDTPYFDTSDKQGNISIPGVPPGKYLLEVWYERAESAALSKLSRTVEIGSEDVALGTIEIQESAKFRPEHLNKHGKQYDPEVTPY